MAPRKPPKSGLMAGAKAPAPLVVQSLQRIEQEVGGRQALVAALLHAPRSKDLDFMLGLIGDPTQASTALADLCAVGGITPGELLTAYKAGMLAGAQVLATRAIGERLPAVVSDVMRRAADYEDDCPMCQGLSQVVPEPSEAEPNPEPVDCPMCQHTGRLRYDGSLEHAKLALSMGRMIDKGGGVNVQVNSQQNNYGGAAAGGSLERLQAATDRILYGSGADASTAIVDAEASEVPDAPEEDATDGSPTPPPDAV